MVSAITHLSLARSFLSFFHLLSLPPSYISLLPAPSPRPFPSRGSKGSLSNTTEGRMNTVRTHHSRFDGQRGSRNEWIWWVEANLSRAFTLPCLHPVFFFIIPFFYHVSTRYSRLFSIIFRTLLYFSPHNPHWYFFGIHNMFFPYLCLPPLPCLTLINCTVLGFPHRFFSYFFPALLCLHRGPP